MKSRLSLSLLFLLSSGVVATTHAAEDLAGPPAVTAEVWAIANPETGEVLWSQGANEPRKAASTTKAMAAYVVLELAKKDSRILDEWMTVSAEAAATTGSRAEFKQGDRLTVRDSLYALMLPSGNDAGNAIAEHFHDRLAPPDAETPQNAQTQTHAAKRVNFVAEMNRTAKRLGMHNTSYRISYGDGGEDHERTTTAHDLVTLTMAARKHALFREVVGTAQKNINVQQADGSIRELPLKNTNRLLDIGGYTGTKTGSTARAGYCLVAEGEHQGKPLIVVTLGSSSDASRFADSRNLFRWAWTQATNKSSR